MSVEVVRSASLKKGDTTQGIIRDKAFESSDVRFGRSRILGGVKSDWHHHASRDLYGFLVAGKLRIEYGEKGDKSVTVEVGDFFHVPPRVVHRDVNPDQRIEAEVVSMLLGEGPTVVNVKGP